MHETVQIKRLREMAARRGWSWTGEPGSGFCGRLQVGSRSWFVIGADLGANSSGAARIARDKAFAQFFLEKAGLPTIPTRVLHSLEEALSLIDFPVLVKPNQGHGGAGVSLAERKEDVAAAYQAARLISPLVLGQPVIALREFRIVVFNRQPWLAYEKKPLTVIGDGVRSIRELILESRGRSRADFIADPRLTYRLQRAALSLETILADGQSFVPLPVANLRSGGKWRACLSELSPALLDASVAAADALGLELAGIDLFAETPTAGTFVINEINASPGLESLAAESALLDPLFAAIEEYLSAR
jgi:D-alanine-D-alanine ligase-like ATP-grasp enzyme